MPDLFATKLTDIPPLGPVNPPSAGTSDESCRADHQHPPVLLEDIGGVTMAQVEARIQGVVGAAPEALNTLHELAAELQSQDSAVDALVTSIATETTNRQAADTTEQAARIAGDSTEATARATADASLQSQITTLSTSVAKDSKMNFVGVVDKTVTNTVSETSLIPGTIIGSTAIPSAVFDTTGYTFKFRASGVFTNTLSTACVLRVKIGSQVTLTTPTFTLPTLSSKAWRAEGEGTVRAGRVVSSSAAIFSDDGTAKLDSVVFTNSDVTITAGDKVVDFTIQWGLAVLSSFTVKQIELSGQAPP